jgi:MCM P-loop domain
MCYVIIVENNGILSHVKVSSRLFCMTNARHKISLKRNYLPKLEHPVEGRLGRCHFTVACRVDVQSGQDGWSTRVRGAGELKHELVGSVKPGDDITVTAILMARADPATNATHATGCLKIYLEAVSVVINSSKKTHCIEECSPKDLKMFETVHTEPMGVFRFLVHSLCPEIYGHEMVKAGLLLALFGGASIIGEDNDVRTKVHVLVVGDPMQTV